VEAERRLQAEDDVLDLYRHWCDGMRLADELAEVFRAARAALGDLPGQIVDDRELRRLLRHPALILHPAVLNDCFFVPTAAYASPTGTAAIVPHPFPTAASRPAARTR